jgi:hypothetical protein
MNMRPTILASALLLTAASAFANPFGQLTVLVPLNPGTVAGADGTQWMTTLWAANTSGHDVTITCTPIIGVDPFIPCPVLKAHSTTSIPEAVESGLIHQGFFLGVPDGIGPTQSLPSIDSVSFSLRVTESVSAPHSAGTEIPLPRPSDFHNATIALAHVPVNANSRSRVRLYGMADGTATVHVIGAESNLELFSAQVTLAGVDTNPIPVHLPQGSALILRYPSFGELALPASFAGSDDAVRIEITPSGSLALWGFASVTDGASEQFTIVSPSVLEYLAISNL